MSPTDLTVSEAAAALRGGELSALAYAEALLARAADRRELNAFIHHDADARARGRARRRCARARRRPARAAARRAARTQGQPRHRGMPTTGGTPGLRGHRPAQQRAGGGQAARRGRDRVRQGQPARARLRHHQQQRRASAPHATPMTRRASRADRAAASARRSARASCRPASAPTPAARSASRRRCAASWVFARPPDAGRRRVSCRSRTRATPPGRWRAASPTACCSTASSPAAVRRRRPPPGPAPRRAARAVLGSPRCRDRRA